MWPISLRKDYHEEHLPAIDTLHLSGKEGAGQGDGVRVLVPRLPVAKPLKVAHTFSPLGLVRTPHAPSIQRTMRRLLLYNRGVKHPYKRLSEVAYQWRPWHGQRLQVGGEALSFCSADVVSSGISLP